jgi:hypothetical protein
MFSLGNAFSQKRKILARNSFKRVFLYILGHAVAQLVESLRYKPEG